MYNIIEHSRMSYIEVELPAKYENQYIDISYGTR
jgi:hypothetical protein